MSTATGMRRCSTTTATTNLALPPRRLIQRPNAPSARRAVTQIEKRPAVVRAAAPESSGQPQSPSAIKASTAAAVAAVAVDAPSPSSSSSSTSSSSSSPALLIAAAGSLAVWAFVSTPGGAPVLAAAAAVAAQLGGKLAGGFEIDADNMKPI